MIIILALLMIILEYLLKTFSLQKFIVLKGGVRYRYCKKKHRKEEAACQKGRKSGAVRKNDRSNLENKRSCRR